MFVFQHPVNVCYEASTDNLSTVAMPRIEVEVRLTDSYGRSDLGGYAVTHLPALPGVHEVSCPVWRPCGSLVDRIAMFFTGGAPHLKDPAMRYGIEEQFVSDAEHGTRLTR